MNDFRKKTPSLYLQKICLIMFGHVCYDGVPYKMIHEEYPKSMCRTTKSCLKRYKMRTRTISLSIASL